MRYSSPQKSGGFTLIEMLVVITVLLAVLTLAYQSISVFMGSANRSLGNFQNAQMAFKFQLSLGSSIRSMDDYYVPSDDGRKTKAMFVVQPDFIRFISNETLLGFGHHSVWVEWKLVPDGEGQQVRLTECPLNKFLPLTEDQIPPQNICRTVDYFYLSGSGRFSAELPKPKRQEFDFMTGQMKDVDTSYRLPLSVTLMLGDETQILTFYPTVLNNKKSIMQQEANFYAPN